MTARTGGCLCGAVGYYFDAEPIASVHCHCKDCQKATGSGFATVFGLADSDVNIEGRQALNEYTVSAQSGQSLRRTAVYRGGKQSRFHMDQSRLTG